MGSGCRVASSPLPGHYRVEWVEDDFVVCAVDLEEPIDLRGFEKRALLEAGEWMLREDAIEWLLKEGKIPVIKKEDLMR